MSKRSKLNFNETWSMAVGGMVGGGIFSTLGVVIAIAGAWAWILIIGYVLTNAVYAFTFGGYLANVVDLGPWFARAAAVAIMALFIGLNLRGVGEAGGVEAFLVWVKLAILVGLAGWGLAHWNTPMLSRGVPDSGFVTAMFGADTVVEHEEVALAIAGQQAFGLTGLIVVTLGAAFSTGSAINSTLFATASLAFLFTFSIVCALAFKAGAGARWITAAGTAAAFGATLTLIYRLLQSDPVPLAALAVLVILAIFGRRFLRQD